jgi:hypothetical protein
MVYTAEPTRLVPKVKAVAIACSVSVTDTVTGPE